ncbi:MAG TPA: hypothetical protein VNS09_25890 [Solirubrobacter sp.]|nr:hypothetical protein [Solirubrobacter sp.]
MLGEIFEVVWVSLLAGIGITTAYSFAVLGMGRSSEARRAGHGVAAVGYGLFTLLFLIVFALGVLIALKIMLTKA